MKKKEIDKFLSKFVEIEIADEDETIIDGRIFRDGNGYVVFTRYSEFPCALMARYIKDIYEVEEDMRTYEL